MLLLLLSSAFAADTTTVLVSALQPRNPESTGLASLIEGFLAQELDKSADIEVLRVEDTPAFEDYAARTYMEGCPPGDIIGCTQVIGERGHARFAVTGTVQSLVGNTKVTIQILDIENSREVISFESELGKASDKAFAEGVAKVLVAAIDGELKEKDIRERDEETGEPIDNDAVAAQLRQLQKEMGGTTAVISRSNKMVKHPDYTMDDLAKRMEGEGTKPWERLGMKPGEYLRYKNSGKSLVWWRQRAMGRAGQVLIRPTVGFESGPFDGIYYGRYAYDTSLTVVDAYSTQVVQTGSGGHASLALAYGLTPYLEAGASFGIVGGNFTVDIGNQTEGQPIFASEPVTSGQSTLVFGPQAQVTFLPVSPVRPTVSAALTVLHGRTKVTPEAVHESLTTYPSPWLVGMQLAPGVELRVSDRVDVFAAVPLSIRLAGDTAVSDRVGVQEVVATSAPAEAGVVGAGVHAGIQVRLFGRKPKDTTRFDEMDEPEE